MRRGAVLGVIGAALAIWTPSASALTLQRMHQREVVAVQRFARSEYLVGYRGPAVTSACRAYGRRGRMTRCVVTVPLYYEPGDQLLGYDSAFIYATYDQYSKRVFLTSGTWILS